LETTENKLEKITGEPEGKLETIENELEDKLETTENELENNDTESESEPSDDEPWMDETMEESESIKTIHKEWENLVLKMKKAALTLPKSN